MHRPLAELAAHGAAAAARIGPYIRRTPLEPSPWLSAAGSCQAYLKLEVCEGCGTVIPSQAACFAMHPSKCEGTQCERMACAHPVACTSIHKHMRMRPYMRCPSPPRHTTPQSEQATNSFKARGAVNKLLALSPAQLDRGLVTCSTGNHALAFVHAVRRVAGAAALERALVYLPKTASAAKVEKLRARGARLVLHGDDCLDAELEARRVAGERGMVYVSPYNDWEVGGREVTCVQAGGANSCRGQCPPVWRQERCAAEVCAGVRAWG